MTTRDIVKARLLRVEARWVLRKKDWRIMALRIQM